MCSRDRRGVRNKGEEGRSEGKTGRLPVDVCGSIGSLASAPHVHCHGPLQIKRRNSGDPHPNPRGPQASPACMRLPVPSPPSGSLPIWSMRRCRPSSCRHSFHAPQTPVGRQHPAPASAGSQALRAPPLIFSHGRPARRGWRERRMGTGWGGRARGRKGLVVTRVKGERQAGK